MLCCVLFLGLRDDRIKKNVYFTLSGPPARAGSTPRQKLEPARPVLSLETTVSRDEIGAMSLETCGRPASNCEVLSPLSLTTGKIGTFVSRDIMPLEARASGDNVPLETRVSRDETGVPK